MRIALEHSTFELYLEANSVCFNRNVHDEFDVKKMLSDKMWCVVEALSFSHRHPTTLHVLNAAA